MRPEGAGNCPLLALVAVDTEIAHCLGGTFYQLPTHNIGYFNKRGSPRLPPVNPSQVLSNHFVYLAKVKRFPENPSSATSALAASLTPFATRLL